MASIQVYPFHKKGPVEAADALSDDAEENPYTRWIVGVLTALATAALGGWVVVTKFAYFIGGRPSRIVEYAGTDAVCLGVAILAVALFVHGHYFWSQSYRFYFISEILKPFSLMLLAGAIGYLLVNQFVLM